MLAQKQNAPASIDSAVIKELLHYPPLSIAEQQTINRDCAKTLGVSSRHDKQYPLLIVFSDHNPVALEFHARNGYWRRMDNKDLVILGDTKKISNTVNYHANKPSDDDTTIILTKVQQWYVDHIKEYIHRK